VKNQVKKRGKGGWYARAITTNVFFKCPGAKWPVRAHDYNKMSFLNVHIICLFNGHKKYKFRYSTAHNISADLLNTYISIFTTSRYDRFGARHAIIMRKILYAESEERRSLQ
jgi:hypothetical protein